MDGREVMEEGLGGEGEIDWLKTGQGACGPGG